MRRKIHIWSGCLMVLLLVFQGLGCGGTYTRNFTLDGPVYYQYDIAHPRRAEADQKIRVVSFNIQFSQKIQRASGHLPIWVELAIQE